MLLVLNFLFFVAEGKKKEELEKKNFMIILQNQTRSHENLHHYKNKNEK